MASLNETQRREVARWIEVGQKLSDIQIRLDKEMGQRLTYMEVRLLVNELQVMPKDPEPVKAPEPPPATDPLPPGVPEAQPAQALAGGPQSAAPGGPGGVSVSVDQITQAGSLVSGKVTFSDGVTAGWFLGQDGRLGLAASTRGYRPPPADVPEFQAALERELARIGM